MAMILNKMSLNLSSLLFDFLTISLNKGGKIKFQDFICPNENTLLSSEYNQPETFWLSSGFQLANIQATTVDFVYNDKIYKGYFKRGEHMHYNFFL